MRLLVDSHVALWWLERNNEMGPECRSKLEQASEVFFSAVTPWELGIKVALGQLSMHHRDPFARMLVAQAQLDVPALVTADRVLSRYGVELVAARSWRRPRLGVRWVEPGGRGVLWLLRRWRSSVGVRGGCSAQPPDRPAFHVVKGCAELLARARQPVSAPRRRSRVCPCARFPRISVVERVGAEEGSHGVSRPVLISKALFSLSSACSVIEQVSQNE